MSSCLQQRWVTYAGNDEEAWKCFLLARSLKRSLTTRPLCVIISDKVSLALGRKLQDEVLQCYWVDPDDHPGLQFRSVAKLRAEKMKELHKSVFLDVNCLALKNCDELFLKNGTQWVGRDENIKGSSPHAAIVVKSRSFGQTEKQLVTELVVQGENPGKFSIKNPNHVEVKELDFCLEVNVKAKTPTPLGGWDLKMVCFTNGHPHEDIATLEKRGPLEAEIARVVRGLCPELHSGNMKVNNQSLTIPSSWELNNSIAIVGMACRYPCANTIAEFWNLLEQGLEGIRKVPEGRWTKDKAFIRMDNMKNTEAGFLSCPIDTFDAKFFNTNAADMHYLDPQQRLSLRVVWEALENSGIDPNTLRNTMTGVFGGWWRNDYKEMLQMLGIADTDFLRGYLGNALGPLTARISHFFELIGPCFSTESGCSTSVVGVDMACDALRSDACNLAIAIGANLLLHPFSPSVMEGVLAPDGRCKTFDASADGFGRAEGIGVLVLKRYGDAVAHGDRIWGLIRGCAVVQEGTSKSIGTPTVDVEARAMELALERSGVDPNDIEFVETHGTGTPVGDPIEVAAVAKAYHREHGRDKPLTIGSVKTNIGHTESVCGIAGIQKSVLAMKNELIPKHLHLNKLNPEVNLAAIPAQIPIDAIPWKRRKAGKPRIAGINSFGITGAQAHVIVQEPPTPDEVPAAKLPFRDTRGTHLLTFSAKTEDAFRVQVGNYMNLLKNPEFHGANSKALKDVEFSMHTGRPHMNLRATVVASSGPQVMPYLAELKATPVPNTPPQVCFLFTGQGSQYPGMAKSLYEENIVFKTNFDWCDAILKNEHGFSLKSALWSDQPNDQLKSTLYSQTSIFCVELCLLRLWQSWGVHPDAVVGHSLGEFAAAVAAGMISPTDALTLVVTRSKLIDALPRAGMLVVGAELNTTLDAMDKAFKNEKKWLDIAAVNSPTQTVLAGPTDIIAEFKLYCDNNEIRTHVLDASHAFHSRLMDPMIAAYEKVAATLTYHEVKKGAPTYISGVEGGVITKVDAAYWVKHTRERVRFLEASHTAVRENQSVFLEVGPHPVLSTLVINNVDDITDGVVTLGSLRRKAEDWDTMLGSLGKLHAMGRPINWENFHRYSSGEWAENLPGYHFEETPYWMGIKDEGSTPFHPLLGSFIPNPSELAIFKSTVNVQRLPFLKDHSLGDKIIFPCVGYVDMCITAGYAATHCSEGNYVKPTMPMCVRNFSIVTPVCLSEMVPTEFQVIVSKTPEGETLSTIYTKVFLDDGTYKWIRNAHATFNTSPPPPPPADQLDLEGIKKRCYFLHESRIFNYKELEDFGFNFGPSCRTVNSGYRNPDCEGEWIFPFKSHETEEDAERFLIHPWCTDPMLQSQIIALGLLNDDQVRKRLVVPVQIDNFTWWGHSALTGYVYQKNTATGNAAYLLDSEGKLMVSMVGTEFMDTTLSNILSLIDSQKNPYPSMAETIWKEKLGVEERRIPAGELGELKIDEIVKEANSKGQEDQETNEFFNGLNQLVGLYLLKGMKDLGLDREKEFAYPEIGEKLGIVPEQMKLFEQFLQEMVEDGWLGVGGKGYKIRQEFPSVAAITKQIDAMKKACGTWAGGKVDLDTVTSLGEGLVQLLTGKGDMPLVTEKTTHFMKESALAGVSKGGEIVEASLLNKLSTLGTKSVVRVLQVGGRSAAGMGHLIKSMVDSGVSHFDYTFTSRHPAVLADGEKTFDDTGVAVKFSILDVDQDPLQQGYLPAHYDIVIASWVMAGSKKVERAIGNLKKLLRPEGYFVMTELISSNKGRTSPSKIVSMVLGGIEDSWKHEDFALRPKNCYLSLEGWSQLLKTAGFKDLFPLRQNNEGNTILLAKLGSDKVVSKTQIVPNDDGKIDTWILFGDPTSQLATHLAKNLTQINFRVISVTRPEVEGDMEEKIRVILRTAMSDETINLHGVIYAWGIDDPNATSQSSCEPFLYIGKHLARSQLPLRVLTLTRGNMSIGSGDYFQHLPHTSPLIGMAQVLANENQDLICKVVDMDPIPTTTPQQCAIEAAAELFTIDDEVMVAYRKGTRCTPRLKPYKIKTAPLPIPSCPRYKLALPDSHLISDLKYIPCDQESYGYGELEMEVKAYCLNFLDVLMVTKPIPEVFDKYNYVGVDIAGIVTAVGPGCTSKVGDRVVAVRRSGVSMPSHLISPQSLTCSIPDDMTYAEAATYPMGILTVGTCLVDVAKGGPGDIVLIHTASGGVGLVGIQIAKSLGCEVVVTAGNERKRNYLRNLGLKHVYNSRTTDYQHDIRKALGGRGVTIVLNSLTSPGFKEATLNLCEKGARFIEMSKMNIWTKEEINKIRPDVFYEVVDVSALTDEKVNTISKYIHAQILAKPEERPTPAPVVSFDASEIREALEYMEKVKHIGKIALIMPEFKSPAGVGTDPYFPIFNDRSTYLITGGLGGIGLEVAKWMGTMGATTILLLGRSSPKPDALEKIESLRMSGVRVEVRLLDVGDEDKMRELFTTEFDAKDKLPPLRGIFHAAGVLDDATYENQTWSRFETVFQSKVKGAWNLHKLSLELPFCLEHFVLFSSITATIGAYGQSNYVAANQYLDALVHYRYSIGLPGVAINWGQWGQVGMASNVVIAMNKPMTTHQGIAALEYAIKSHKTQLAAHESDLGAMKQALISTKGLLADVEQDGAGHVSGELDGDEFWREYDACTDRDEKYDVLRKFLKRLIRITLHMDKNEEIDDNVNFQDIGMDSLMMVEMKNGLQASVGKRVKISINAVKDCKTVAQLSDRLVELISGIEELPAPTDDELVALVKKDARLPENIQVDDALAKTAGSLQTASTVLVIGSTGTLGPYVMRELVKRPHIKRIICVMQPNPLISPTERFQKVFEKKGLLSSIPMERITCVPGDIKELRFGMSAPDYEKLTAEVDVVFNLAVKVAFDEVYRETQDPKSSRVVNVFGMRNVLQFAVDGGKLKYVFHASTFAAETMVDDEGGFWESWPSEDEVLMFPNSAYSISKLICDRLVEQAVERGVPCKVFRLPQIGGDSVTGGNIQLDSFLMMRCLAYMYIGSMHAQSIPLSLMAVDQCAKLCVDLFFHAGTRYEMYNLLNPHLGDEREFETLAREFGVAVKVMDSYQFLDKFKSMDSNDEMLQLVRFATSKDSELLHLKEQEMPFYTSWRNGNKRIFYSKKLEKLIPEQYPSCITPSWDVLRGDLRFAKDSGVFDRYKIKHSNPYLLS
ncbi:phenolphthiocerol synthesis polyketide synthase type I Pks15/1 isoform X2 [Folsomia candida]|uniref:phenolphthiocerol synthesis polyketide synthase type I Pks15/1 isoform X2 n=1 Tax=Folsomia candida TaxID=158441 RepID=UPI00160540D9|nr:phenolphthiocerol synthesis polyketide synthase type I Pks15/1 isoform X2 [Folsomia candida]